MDLESLSLTEIVRLQTQLAEVLRRRFERSLALSFTDIVGSTAYFARYGDAAGKALQQRHLDLLLPILAEHGGRLVDTAGDGAFACFPTPADGARAMVRLASAARAEGQSLPEAHRLVLRVGLHWGRVLTDGAAVSGDAVNLCARVAAAAGPGVIVVTRDAFMQLPPELRLQCSTPTPTTLKGIADPVELWTLESRGGRRPVAVVAKETGARILIPRQSVVSFGRLRTHDGRPANDVVLTLSDPVQTRLISRWHFELHDAGEELSLRALTEQGTTVDGVPIARDAHAPIRVGSVVDVAGVLTLTFVDEAELDPLSQSTSARGSSRE